jgi:transcriptional regulator with XRE-family HTH domain
VGWTQKDLADHAGLADRTVRALERGQRKPYKQNVQALADALRLSEHPPAPDGGTPMRRRRFHFTESMTPTYNLPTELTTLVNREQEVADIMALLQRPSRRLLTLTGPGGVGKTRLALRVAGELRPTFTNGVVFVDLGRSDKQR